MVVYLLPDIEQIVTLCTHDMDSLMHHLANHQVPYARTWLHSGEMGTWQAVAAVQGHL
jgi:hypothetical protein